MPQITQWFFLLPQSLWVSAVIQYHCFWTAPLKICCKIKFEDASTYSCQHGAIHLLIFGIFSTSLKQSVNVKSFVAYTDTSFGFILSVNFFISEPIFVDAHVIPDGTDPNDAKIYFFFKERLTDNSGSTKQIHSMIARVCPVRTILFTRLLG